MIVFRLARTVSILVFGIFVPLALLFQAYVGLSSLGAKVGGDLANENPSQIFDSARKLLHNGNDYALYSVIAAEHANQVVVTNKQIMKVVVIQIGFAVVSIGIMFIILGIRDGGAEGAFDAAGIKFDFKTGSTGAVVFVIGAAMAAAGGILKNEYQTVPIPSYVDRLDGEEQRKYAISISRFKQCSKQDQSIKYECFYKFFEAEFQGDLR